MISGILTIATFASVALFPWPLSVLLAVIASSREPLVPFAAGLFADTLYYVPFGGTWPLFTIGGFLVSATAFFVHGGVRRTIIN